MRVLTTSASSGLHSIGRCAASVCSCTCRSSSSRSSVVNGAGQSLLKSAHRIVSAVSCGYPTPSSEDAAAGAISLNTLDN